MSSPSSITTSIPTGAISQWCLLPHSPRANLFGAQCPEPLASGSPSSSPDDYQGICCDGVIVDTSFDIYNNSSTSSPIIPYSDPNAGLPHHPVYLADLICCGVAGTQTAALAFAPASTDPRTACAPGTAGTPLASLAATNVGRATPYLVTYADSTSPSSSSGGAGDPSATVTNDLWGWGSPRYGASGTPVCFLANTKKEGGAGVVEVTVAATYVAPTSTSTTPTISADGSESAEGSTGSSGPGSWGVQFRPKTSLCVTLGLMVLGLLLM
ncbi:uncharacterized protein F4812DRAFT_318770 [Daldinia caldariorum]|uniref:uncharacterized protein n=1 Tax=Daldinia caldariorum TaxID=326644 RepID=UPI002008C93A|nr:uncharacterized protein F4812DRAFT_318770 [Daldinia caldariorum]KAI1469080.1 hypothetical protein F4812DRAFT_318770 [Daldinia caldariorum]